MCKRFEERACSSAFNSRSPPGARRFCEALQQEGILAKETHEDVIRFAPPLVIDKETIDGVLPAIRAVLNLP